MLVAYLRIGDLTVNPKIPENQDIPKSGATPLPPTTTGTMGDHQIVLYDPKVASQSPLKRIAQTFQERVSQLLRRSLEKERYAAQHLKQYGEGKIFVLLGHSTAGKTSIIKQLRREQPEWIESGQDIHFPSQDADLVRSRAPELYERMAPAMEHVDIGHAVMGDVVLWKPGISKAVQADAQAALEEARKMGLDTPSRDADIVKDMEPELYKRMAQAVEHGDIARVLFGDRPPRWKADIPPHVKEDAQKAFEEAKRKKDTFPLVDYTQEHERKMEEEVIEHAMRGESVIFDPYDEKAFLARMIEKNNFAPLKLGLAYCPFPDLAERVAKRNINALASGRLDDYRDPLAPLEQFCDFYRPAERGETVLDTLHRSEVEQAFEHAFKQQADFLLKQVQEPTTADNEHTDLVKKHDDMKAEIMKKLGFSDPSVMDVDITTSRQGIDYLFRTNVMTPSESSAIIQEWK